MKAQPSPNHKLYVKVGKPHVKRWIMPMADPDPKVWVLAETVAAPIQEAVKPNNTVVKEETISASTEMDMTSAPIVDPLSSIPDVSAKAEEKPKAEPKPRAKRAPRKTTPKTKSAE